MINLDSYTDYLKSALAAVLSKHSPTGYYTRVMPLIKEYANELGAGFYLTNKGCAVLSVKGEDSAKVVALSAHCDTLGAMVRSISDGGEIAFTKVGGPLLSTLDGEYCTLITREEKEITGTFLSKSPSVHVYDDSATRTHNETDMYVRLDTIAKTAEELRELGVENGNYICIDTKTQFTESGHVKSRFLDDKASVAAILTVLKYLKDNDLKPKYDTKIIFTVYEEVGHGASWLPEGISEMVAVDMGCVGLDLLCTEQNVSICVKDSTGPYDYALTNKLIHLAKENGISYAADIYPHYGSDIGAAREAGYDIKGALIGTGVQASHGMERTHLDGLKNTMALIIAYLTND
ncbi:MAG: M42 family metallopeptidase [Clostridia bacterium]